MADANSNEPVSSVAIGKREISLIAFEFALFRFLMSALSVSSSVLFIFCSEKLLKKLIDCISNH